MANFLNQQEEETLQNILCRWSRALPGTEFWGCWGKSETILWFPSVPSRGKSFCSLFFSVADPKLHSCHLGGHQELSGSPAIFQTY